MLPKPNGYEVNTLQLEALRDWQDLPDTEQPEPSEYQPLHQPSPARKAAGAILRTLRTQQRADHAQPLTYSYGRLRLSDKLQGIIPSENGLLPWNRSITLNTTNGPCRLHANADSRNGNRLLRLKIVEPSENALTWMNSPDWKALLAANPDCHAVDLVIVTGNAERGISRKGKPRIHWELYRMGSYRQYRYPGLERDVISWCERYAALMHPELLPPL